MTTPAFRALLDAAKDAHRRVPALAEFCAFPTDLTQTEWDARHIPPADLMLGDPLLRTDGADPLTSAFLEAGGDAYWRLTYEDTNIGQDFLDRFGCYCLIGPNAPWDSREMAAFVVYMPPNLHYPWHHHPAEEIYYVLEGEAEFLLEGAPSKLCRAGDAQFHGTNKPHATQTGDVGMLAYVLWRNHLDIAPVLTERGVNPA